MDVPGEDATIRRPPPLHVGLAPRADRLGLPLPFHRPLEQGQRRGLGLSSLRLDRLLGHELRPVEQRLLRLFGFVVESVNQVGGIVLAYRP